MPGNVSGLATLENHSRLPAYSFRYIPDADASVVSSIDNGILFLAAFWSGPSLMAFASLTKAMLQLKRQDLELVVLDVDGCAPTFTKYSKIMVSIAAVWKHH